MTSVRALPRCLAENRSSAKRRGAGSFVGCSCFLLNLTDDLVHGGPVVIRAEMGPAGQRLEDDALRRRKVAVWSQLSSTPRIELLCSVVPKTGQRRAFDQRSSTVDTGPFERASHETFLAGLRQDVAQASYLSCLFVAHLDWPVAPPPESFAPAGESPCLLGQIALEVLHEARELLRRFDAGKKVKVIREEGHCEKLDLVEPLSAT